MGTGTIPISWPAGSDLHGTVGGYMVAFFALASTFYFFLTLIFPSLDTLLLRLHTAYIAWVFYGGLDVVVADTKSMSG
jgi:hypothetical protein